jgi:S-adenosylmethionine uptake transporter
MPPSRPATVGLGLYLAGVFLFALNDALGKWLVADYGVGQLMMLRSIGAACVLRADGPFAAPRPLRRHTGASARPAGRLHGRRHVLLLLGAGAPRYMPLADVMTFYMA